MTATRSAAPRLSLVVGTATRHAVWKSGQGPGSTHRFEYTVQAGELDTDGVRIEARSLEAPTGSAIVTVASAESVRLVHRSVHDAVRTVDGINPAPATGSDAAVVEGPVLTLTWTEALDPDTVPSAPGGFTVRIDGATGPEVRAIALDATQSTKSFASPFRSGVRTDATNVTLDYAPRATPLRDLAGNRRGGIRRPGGDTTGRDQQPRDRARRRDRHGHRRADPARERLRRRRRRWPAPRPGSPFEWLRLDNGTEIVAQSRLETGATSTYTLVGADAGKRMKVRVRFEDYLGNAEAVESAEYPSFGRVAWDSDAGCAMPNLAGRELVWTARSWVWPTVLASGNVQAVTGSLTGISPQVGTSLSDTHLHPGGHDPVHAGHPWRGRKRQDSTLNFSTHRSDLPRTSATAGLVLHVCDQPFHFGDGPDADTNRTTPPTAAASGFTRTAGPPRASTGPPTRPGACISAKPTRPRPCSSASSSMAPSSP